MSTVRVKRGDVGRQFTETITLTGLTQSPTTPDSAKFLMRQGTTLVSKTATVGAITYNAGAGTATVPLSYVTVAGDLDLATGGWKQEWEIAWTGGSKITAPTDGYNWVVVEADLNPA